MKVSPVQLKNIRENLKRGDKIKIAIATDKSYSFVDKVLNEKRYNKAIIQEALKIAKANIKENQKIEQEISKI